MSHLNGYCRMFGLFLCVRHYRLSVMFTLVLKLVSSISSLAVWICYWIRVEAITPLNMSPFRRESMRDSWSLETALSTLFRSLRLTMMESLSSSLSQVINVMVCTSVLDVLYHIVGFLCKWKFLQISRIIIVSEHRHIALTYSLLVVAMLSYL